MADFPGDIVELEETFTYELGLLEYLRQALFNESESTDQISMVFGDLTDDGHQKRTVYAAMSEDISAAAVGNALSRFRPLAFSAAFKLHDMIVEWILKENTNWTSSHWRFAKKIELYDQLSSHGNLIQPALLQSRPQVSLAFWKLYRFLARHRNTVAHAAGVSVATDGSLHFRRSGELPFDLSAEDQSSYIRVLCLIAKCLIGQMEMDNYREAVLESSLAALKELHQIVSFQRKHNRLFHLRIDVPIDRVLATDPLVVDIDWAQIREMMNRSVSSSGNDRGFFSVTIEVESDVDIARWALPVEAVPWYRTGIAVGDARYDQYFQRIATA